MSLTDLEGNNNILSFCLFASNQLPVFIFQPQKLLLPFWTIFISLPSLCGRDVPSINIKYL